MEGEDLLNQLLASSHWAEISHEDGFSLDSDNGKTPAPCMLRDSPEFFHANSMLHINSTCPISQLETPQQQILPPPVFCGPSGMAVISGSINEISVTGFSHGDSPSTNSIQPIWQQPYMHGVSSIFNEETKAFAVTADPSQDKGVPTRKRGWQEEFVEQNISSTARNLDNFVGATGPQPLQQQDVGFQMPHLDHGNSTSKMQGNDPVITQPEPMVITNGVAKPRVRARRGQATDPHSIAERLRRERIAERMKSLQELVPNSNKTDKASMLDEIIDYVRFLQMQVKVLSASRLGGASANPSLRANLQNKGFGNQTSTFASHATGAVTQATQAFEKEVAKLMELNVTAAMQYLQSKGLCLMPMALATAIPNTTGKFVLSSGSTDLVQGTLSSEKKISSTTDSVQGTLSSEKKISGTTDSVQGTSSLEKKISA